MSLQTTTATSAPNHLGAQVALGTDGSVQIPDGWDPAGLMGGPYVWTTFRTRCYAAQKIEPHRVWQEMRRAAEQGGVDIVIAHGGDGETADTHTVLVRSHGRGGFRAVNSLIVKMEALSSAAVFEKVKIVPNHEVEGRLGVIAEWRHDPWQVHRQAHKVLSRAAMDTPCVLSDLDDATGHLEWLDMLYRYDDEAVRRWVDTLTADHPAIPQEETKRRLVAAHLLRGGMGYRDLAAKTAELVD